jgi:hypothetical protein
MSRHWAIRVSRIEVDKIEPGAGRHVKETVGWIRWRKIFQSAVGQ